MLFNFMDKPLRSIQFKVLALCCVSFSSLAANITLTLVDVNNEPMQDMVAYIEPIDDIVLTATNNTVEVGQLDRAFTPYISVMQRGNSVKFHNKDDITHHIYSAVGDNKFSYKIKAGESRSKDDFPQLGEVAMGCNIHDWMSGYLLVLDTPLFGKTNPQGLVEIDVPISGKYKLVIWHPQLDATNNRVTREINIPVDSSVTMKINNKMREISAQKNEDDFDFLSDY